MLTTIPIFISCFTCFAAIVFVDVKCYHYKLFNGSDATKNTLIGSEPFQLRLTSLSASMKDFAFNFRLHPLCSKKNSLPICQTLMYCTIFISSNTLTTNKHFYSYHILQPHLQPSSQVLC